MIHRIIQFVRRRKRSNSEDSHFTDYKLREWRLSRRHPNGMAYNRFFNTTASIQIYMIGLSRFIRSFSDVICAITAYYCATFGLDSSSQQYCRYVKNADNRQSYRMWKLSCDLGGLFTKFGQYIATLDHVVPKPYVEMLSQLQDRAPPVEWPAMKKVIREELKKDLGDIFKYITEDPIASASLAQVHYALRVDGSEVALKIQYPNVERLVKSDLWTMKKLSKIVTFFFPSFSYAWIIPEFERTLKQEMDFRQEAYNSERMGNLLRNKCQNVHIPNVYWDLTTKRVLCMEFVHGCKLTDIEKLSDMGLSSKRRMIGTMIADMYGKMTCCLGLIHADPHPGNLLIRCSPSKDGQPELVLLDHGMYRRVSPDVRNMYCNLVKTLMLQRFNEARDICKGLGITEDCFGMLVFALTMRPAYSRDTPLGCTLSPNDIELVRSQIKPLTLMSLNSFLRAMPKDLFWILRTHNVIRSLNSSLGGTTRDRLLVGGMNCIRGSSVDNRYVNQVEELLLSTHNSLTFKNEITKPSDACLQSSKQILKDSELRRYCGLLDLPGESELNIPVALEMNSIGDVITFLLKQSSRQSSRQKSTLLKKKCKELLDANRKIVFEDFLLVSPKDVVSPTTNSSKYLRYTQTIKSNKNRTEMDNLFCKRLTSIKVKSKPALPEIPICPSSKDPSKKSLFTTINIRLSNKSAHPYMLDRLAYLHRYMMMIWDVLFMSWTIQAYDAFVTIKRQLRNSFDNNESNLNFTFDGEYADIVNPLKTIRDCDESEAGDRVKEKRVTIIRRIQNHIQQVYFSKHNNALDKN